MDQVDVALSSVRAVVERGLERALVEGDRWGFEAGVGAGAGPGPVERVADEAGCDRVAGEVAVRAEEVVVVVDPRGVA